jgi:flagellar hook-length control protein FliK
MTFSLANLLATPAQGSTPQADNAIMPGLVPTEGSQAFSALLAQETPIQEAPNFESLLSLNMMPSAPLMTGEPAQFQQATSQAPLAGGMLGMEQTIPSVKEEDQEEQIPDLGLEGAGIQEIPVTIVAPETSPSLMKELGAKADDIKKAIPILDIMSGDYSKFNPKDIPAMVFKNDFIRNALASGDIDDFLSKPAPLQLILDELKASTTSLTLPGVDMNQITTPKEILTALGIDASQISSELHLLQKTLGLSEELPLAANQPAAKSESEEKTKSTKPVEREPIASQPINPSIKPSEEKPTGRAPVRPDMTVARQPTANAEVKISKNETSDHKAVPTARISRSEVDPFAAIKDDAKALHTLTMQPTAKIQASQATVQPAAISPDNIGIGATAPNISETIQAKGAASASRESIPAASTSVVSKPQLQDFLARFEIETNQQPAIQIGTMDSAPSESTDQDANAGFEGFNSPEFGSPSLTQSPSKTPSSFTSLMDVPTPEHASLPQKIMDNASMLVKDGGGSIRLDFTTAEFGKVDVAIDVKGDQVDVRILSPHESTRDAIALELNRLKDSLGSHNLNLGKVEFGLANHNQSSNSGHQQNQQFAAFQDFQNQQQRPSWLPEQQANNFTSNHRPKSYQFIPQRNFTTHNGRIQVFA